MPVRLRNKSPEAVSGPDIPGVVEPNEIADIPGDLVSDKGDTYLITKGEDVRAWPKASWSLVSDVKSKKEVE